MITLPRALPDACRAKPSPKDSSGTLLSIRTDIPLEATSFITVASRFASEEWKTNAASTSWAFARASSGQLTMCFNEVRRLGKPTGASTVRFSSRP